MNSSRIAPAGQHSVSNRHRERKFRFQRSSLTGSPGGTQEISCIPGQFGILAQKFWAREKFNGEFFFGTSIQNPKKNSVKY
jgi:hypothetical protein